jgi:AraC-like DNA-binding protein
MSEYSEKFLERIPSVLNFRIIEYDNVYSSHTHQSNAHELLYVLDGRMTLHLGQHLEYQAGPGDFLIIPARTPHRDEFAVLKGLRIQLIIFNWDAGEYFRQVDCGTLAALPGEISSEARRRLEFMRACWEPGDRGKLAASLQLHGVLSLFYFAAEIARSRKLPPPPDAEMMHRVKHFLDQNFSSQMTLKDAAEFVSLSPSYLSRRFHHEFGVSFNAYLTARRLESARHLLQTTRLQIAEIAARCGFSSSSYFIKVFRAHYGVTPKNHTVLPSLPRGKKGM